MNNPYVLQHFGSVGGNPFTIMMQSREAVLNMISKSALRTVMCIVTYGNMRDDPFLMMLAPASFSTATSRIMKYVLLFFRIACTIRHCLDNRMLTSAESPLRCPLNGLLIFNLRRLDESLVDRQPHPCFAPCVLALSPSLLYTVCPLSLWLWLYCPSLHST